MAKRICAALLAACCLLLALAACGKEPAALKDLEESYLLKGTYLSEDQETVVHYALHCYVDNTLVLECHQNRGGTWSEGEDGGLELTIDGVKYTAKKSQYTGKISFKFDDRLGSQAVTVRLETALDTSQFGGQSNQDEIMIRTYEKTVQEMAQKFAGRDGEVIFYGGSNFVKWSTLDEDMEGYPVQNKSFGGSNDVTRHHFMKELIYDSNPAIVLYMSSSNDWTQGKSLEEVTEFKQKLFDEMAENLPDTVFIILSSTPNPLRYYGEYQEKMQGCDRWTAEYCAGHENFEYIDVVPALSLKEGAEPNRELWLDDDLHLNEAGYEILAQVVREKLAEVCESCGITFPD